MKPVNLEFSAITVIFFTAMLLLFSSCDVYYFSQPQPFDRPDLYRIPQAFRGQWVSENSDDEIIVKENIIQVISNAYTERVTKGIWPQKDSTGTEFYPQNPFSVMQYDQVSKQYYKRDNYVIADSFIYEITKKDNLGKGYRWKENKDTILYEQKDTLYIDLGKNAFLRQVDANTFVLNVRSHLIIDGVNQVPAGWWFVTILQLKKDGTVDCWSNTEKTDSLACMIHNGSSSEMVDNYFMNCTWSAATIKTLLKNGYFQAVNFKIIRKNGAAVYK